MGILRRQIWDSIKNDPHWSGVALWIYAYRDWKCAKLKRQRAASEGKRYQRRARPPSGLYEANLFLNAAHQRQMASTYQNALAQWPSYESALAHAQRYGHNQYQSRNEILGGILGI